MMSNDELQRKMDFIVNQQAQFSSDIQQLKELHAQAEQRMTKIEDVVLRLGNATVALTERVADLATAQTHLDTKMAELADSQAHTDQRLNALIDIVPESRNGRDRG
jgi:chromosome segregation ATPase